MSYTVPPSEVEEHAKAAGKTMADVCREAGIAQSTFSRWKAGHTSPTLEKYNALLKAAAVPHTLNEAGAA
jgi:transcriptional regulator with XRE-family HTH domain